MQIKNNNYMASQKSEPNSPYSPPYLGSHSANSYNSSPHNNLQSKLYHSERFVHEDLPNVNKNNNMMNVHGYNNLSNSIQGLFTRYQQVKQQPQPQIDKTFERSASSKNILPSPQIKKPMDVSGFPMPNLANNTFLKGLSKPNFSKTQSKPQNQEFNHINSHNSHNSQNNSKQNSLNSYNDDRKAVSPPTDSLYKNQHTGYMSQLNKKNYDYELKANVYSADDIKQVETGKYINPFNVYGMREVESPLKNKYESPLKEKYESPLKDKYESPLKDKYGIDKNSNKEIQNTYQPNNKKYNETYKYDQTKYNYDDRKYTSKTYDFENKYNEKKYDDNKYNNKAYDLSTKYGQNNYTNYDNTKYNYESKNNQLNLNKQIKFNTTLPQYKYPIVQPNFNKTQNNFNKIESNLNEIQNNFNKKQQNVQTFGFNNILGTPKKAMSFEKDISTYTYATTIPEHQSPLKMYENQERHPNAFARTNSTPPNANLLKAGLMGIPNLKMSMQIQDDAYEGPSSQFLKLDQIIQKQTDQKYFVKKSVIFNQCSLRDFELGKCVGSGKFGDVHICRHRQTGTMFALKKVFKSTILEYNMVNQFTRQLKIHYKLDHPNIVKLYAHFDDEYHVFLLMEYAESGILMDRIKCAEDIASRYVSQTIDAVMYLHKLKIAHRDIKPENIVLQFNDVMKLCDFGWSSFYQNQMKTTFCGTLDYLSPEMKEGGQYDNSVDIWSIGVLTYQLITGSPPYRKELMMSMKGNSKSNKKINWNVNYPPSISPLAESFIRNLLKENPQQRATLRFCSTHTFIKKYQLLEEQSVYYDEFKRVIN